MNGPNQVAVEFLTPLLFGLGTGAPLIVGAAAGVHWEPPQKLVAALLAFASGALITGLAFELFEPAYQSAGITITTASLLVGTSLYVGIKYVVERTDRTNGVPLLAAVVFDGLAENVTLGVVLVGDPASSPLAILSGIAANNLPEAIGGATQMADSGRSTTWTLGVWTATALGLALTVLFGYVAFSGASETLLAVIRATGGGAVLASLAVEIMPDAYEGGGPGIAFATALGFAVTFLLA